MARPKKPIDPDQLKKLAALDCSLEEMASFFNVDQRTLTRRFAQVIRDGRNSGKISLKRKQFEVAMSGSVPMLIWLGKIRLGQRDTTIPDNEADEYTHVTEWGTSVRTTEDSEA